MNKTAQVKRPTGAGGMAGGGGHDQMLDANDEIELSLEEAQDKCSEILSTEIMSQITDSNWKNRLSAMESINNVS